VAQRQFRSDDTDQWGYKYGSAKDGSVTVDANETDSAPNTTLTGTSGGTSATAGSGTGFANGDIVFIHQTQGTGAGNWELNKISSVGGGTNWTMAKNLMNTYAAGAQVVKLVEHLNYTINSSKTVTVRAWDGSKGGILVRLAKIAITHNGNINAVAMGFRGGASATNNGSSYQGESSVGAGGQSESANGASGGGGAGDDHLGGGGGHVSAGGTGSGRPSASGGASIGQADLVVMHLGHAGGGASEHNSNGVPAAPNGGGLVFFIAPSISGNGTITVNGTASTAGGDADQVVPGSSAAGSILFKGVNINLSSMTVTAVGGSATVAGSRTGATGSNGRIHADYSKTITGTTNPSIDSRQDLSLNVNTGAAMFFL
jgi:hypothetical protein